MGDSNSIAYSEVVEVLNHTDKKLVNKISKKFMDFLIQNADENYNSNINFYDENWENTISDDARAILAIIYIDYMLSPEERNELLIEDEKEKNKLYNSDNLFKKKSETKSINKQDFNNNLSVEVKKEGFFEKIFSFIKNLFKR